MRGSALIMVTAPTAAISRFMVLLSAVSIGYLLAPLALAAPAANPTIVAGYRFTSFDAPGGGGFTDPHHMNNNGAITGRYQDSNGVHGFVRSKAGVITSFDPPSSIYTDPEGINDSGDVVGWYVDANSLLHGFLRDAKGTMTSIDVPFPGNQGTAAVAISAEGTIQGVYLDANGNHQIFQRRRDGEFTAVVPAGEVFGAVAESINNRGAMSGWFIDSNSVFQGFLRQADGPTISFEAPLAGSGSGQGTLPTVDFQQGSHNALNERGDLTGSAVDANYTAHGFLRTHEGEFFSFDLPEGVGNYNGTVPSSINSSGTIVGSSFDDNDGGHGFVRYADGSLVPFDAPDADPASGGTVVYVINDAGAIAGAWADGSGNVHGFVMTRNADD